MNSYHRTPAEETAAKLQHAARDGQPVLIPGAFEVRVGHSGVQLGAPAPHLAVVRERPSAITDGERIALELEGGGAPSQRRTDRQKTFIARLRHLLRRRPQIATVAGGVAILECCSMPYTYKSLALVWLITFGLVVLTGSGLVAGPWVLLVLAVALATPVLILRSPASAFTRSFERPQLVASERDRSRLNLDGMDVHRWENKGARHGPIRP